MNKQLSFSEAIPLGLYVHFPWCVRKCPYCDFNSHTLEPTGIDEEGYIDALLVDLEDRLPSIWGRKIMTVFIGGGTPSLLSGTGITRLLDGIRTRVSLSPNAEITLEANPGTRDSANFAAYRSAGVNRLSIGVQSLDDGQLAALGRIHSADAAIESLRLARRAGFEDINADLMFGLPMQTVSGAVDELHRLLGLEPAHVSYYQLTLEPNTPFYRAPPAGLPDSDESWSIQQMAQKKLLEHGFTQYEVSAWSTPNRECRHNLNYWQFGDYLGIGAGAHSKLTDLSAGCVTRSMQPKNPILYAQKVKARRAPAPKVLSQHDIVVEFFMNALRLRQGVRRELFVERTGLDTSALKALVDPLIDDGWLTQDPHRICTTDKGFHYLDTLMQTIIELSDRQLSNVSATMTHGLPQKSPYPGISGASE